MQEAAETRERSIRVPALVEALTARTPIRLPCTRGLK